MRRLADVTDVSVTRIRGRDRLGRRNRERIQAIEWGEVEPIAPQRVGKPEMRKLAYEAGVAALKRLGLAPPQAIRRK